MNQGKTFGLFLALLNVSFFVSGQTMASSTAVGPGQMPPATSYSVISRGPNSAVWESYTHEQKSNGKTIARRHEYTELASGLNFKNPNTGQWTPSKEEIDILSDGTAAATQGQHKAYFPGDIYDGFIEMVTPDGEHLKSRPVGLSYDDGNNTVLIAVLTNSAGELLQPNKIIYPDAFQGISASVRYTYARAGFEQDIILQRQLPSPESFGLNLATTRLQVLTEFYDGNNPVQSASSVNSENRLSDVTLTFGQMKIVHGHAFTVDNNLKADRTPTYKSWLNLNGRKFLVESVPYKRLAPQLARLPQTTWAKIEHPMMASASRSPHNEAMVDSILGKVSSIRLLPSQHLAQANNKAIQLAKTELRQQREVVLDYTTLSGSATNYTFQGDATYDITGPFAISDTATFEGGTVIKYEAGVGACIQVNNVICKTGPYRPAVFTAEDDDSVGETISGSSGSPSGYYADPALDVGNGSVNLQYMRFIYANWALHLDPSIYDVPYYLLQNIQILHSYLPIYEENIGWDPYLTVENCLFSDVSFGFQGALPNVVVENLTIGGCDTLVDDDGGAYGGNTIYFTNSIFANVTNIEVDGASSADGGYNGFYNSSSFGASQFTNAAWPFQTVGGGNYYLTNNSSYRSVGTANIDSAALAEIQTKTTYPPMSYPGDGTLGPQASRDTNAAPDLGYHYDPVDYLINANVNVNFLPGTVVAFGGIGLDYNDRIDFQGTATQPCWFIAADTVQESAGDAGLTAIESVYFEVGGISSQFTKFSALPHTYFFADSAAAYPTWTATNCEFYGGILDSGDGENGGISFYFKNCLFWRANIWDAFANSWNFENCTFWNGNLSLQGDCSIFNTTFNDTTISNSNLGTTLFDYNAFLTNADRLIPYGTHDVTNIINFNWQSSWLGDFYLPPNSSLIDAGNTNADLLGLYHFTAQTNQVTETNSIVDIGYHYVATDAAGNPLDSNGNGKPDYLEDSTGRGQPLTITLTSPANNTYYKEPATVPLQVSIFDWRGNVTNVSYYQGLTGITGITNSPFSYTWPIVAHGQYSLTATAYDTAGSNATSASISVTVTNLCGY